MDRGQGLPGLALMRQRAGMTLQAVADELGVQKQTVANWEHPRRGAVHFGMLPRLAAVLDCTVEDLFSPVDLYAGGEADADNGNADGA